MASPVPIFESKGLIVRGDDHIEVGSVTAAGPRVALWDDAGLIVPAILDRTQIVEGSILLSGREPASLLYSGEAAYIPRLMPLPSDVKVIDALGLSARLLGLSSSDARRALSRCRLTAHGTKKLGELTRLQMRLTCIAHGLIGNPQLFVVENVFEDLDEPESEIVEGLLEEHFEDRAYLLACRGRDPSSRSLGLRSDQSLSVAGTQVLPPAPPDELSSQGYWVSCVGDATPLIRPLEGQGARVTRSPRASVLLVHEATGSLIFRSARDAGLSVVELTPAGLGRDPA